MPVRGAIYIVFIAVVIAVLFRDQIYEWLKTQTEDDGIDDKNFKEDKKP